ncbi:heavy-metal-associated domain-containing protein [Yinghuangia sp. YIM S10712]|uniref:heavy-metal-associated domain-containing protein n=1 Tax=Yinghuangia sp. YIM S10712 TaxID=3436930 RepID=UPI003F531FCD
MSTATFTVTGMTCGHCVSSVEEEVSEIVGVREVKVELATGRLTVSAEGDVDAAAVEAAVTAAGCALAR